MPELPEVEVTRLSFVNQILKANILNVYLGKNLRYPFNFEVKDLINQQILDVKRKAKYLLLELINGVLIIHLGMSGSLRFNKQLSQRNKHEHFELITNKGILRLNDPRRFGLVLLIKNKNYENDLIYLKLFKNLGAEPLNKKEFLFEEFKAGLNNTKTSIKQLLLNGKLVVGIGNIYASEILFESKINPEILANQITENQIKDLFKNIPKILNLAISLGGSSLKDFSNATGQTGYFQLNTKVYNRENLPCLICGTLIQKFKQNQRATYFCPNCQKM